MTKTALERLEELRQAAYNQYTQTGDRYDVGKFAAYDAAIQIVESTGWQPIETAPKDGTTVFLAVEGEVNPVIAEWQEKSGDWDDVNQKLTWEYCWVDVWNSSCCYEPERVKGNITHWMPLPQAPKGGK